MGVKRKTGKTTITILISKKAECMLRRYAREIPRKDGSGIKGETNLTVLDRILLDPKEYQSVRKPLREQPLPTLNRFNK